MKELKRYILTNRNRIFDLSMQHILGNSSMLGGWGKGRNSYIGHRLEIGEEYPIENETAQGFIIKTSNSILDLVEVNDLLEIDNDWEILKVIMFNKNNQLVCRVRTSSSSEDYTVKDYRESYIKAIYKLQLNGDYKRYEVKGVIK